MTVDELPVPADRNTFELGLDSLDLMVLSRRLRYLKNSDLEGVAPKILRVVADRARAASYSCLVIARRLEHRAEVLDPGGAERDRARAIARARRSRP